MSGGGGMVIVVFEHITQIEPTPEKVLTYLTTSNNRTYTCYIPPIQTSGPLGLPVYLVQSEHPTFFPPDSQVLAPLRAVRICSEMHTPDPRYKVQRPAGVGICICGLSVVAGDVIGWGCGVGELYPVDCSSGYVGKNASWGLACGWYGLLWEKGNVMETTWRVMLLIFMFLGYSFVVRNVTL